MNRSRLSVLLMTLFFEILVSAQSVAVNKVSNLATSFNRLALLPVVGPTGVDTIWIEGLLAGKFASRGLPVMPASATRQRMFDLEIRDLSDENRRTLAEKLEVDAFIAVSVDAVLTENTGSVGFVILPGLFSTAPSERHIGSVQLAIVSAETGKVLMQGSAFGQSQLRSEKGVIGKTFDAILDGFLTPQFFAERKNRRPN